MMNPVLLPGCMESRFVTPKHVGGWLEVRLNKTEMDYLWIRIKAAEGKDEDRRNTLAGQISSSLVLDDLDNYFQDNVLYPLADEYFKHHPFYSQEIRGNRMTLETKNSDFNIVLDEWWVNKQKQGEYNPIHNHSGLFSFAIWMQEPAEYDEQNKHDNAKASNMPSHNQFAFHYSTMLDQMRSSVYPLGKHSEGTMVFFPAKLFHSVNPFFDNDGIRISIAGNMCVHT